MPIPESFQLINTLSLISANNGLRKALFVRNRPPHPFSILFVTFSYIKTNQVMNTKTAAILIGIIFIAVGILGFVSNPIVGNSHDAIFHTDGVHNGVHIASGVLFLLVAFAAPASTGFFLKLFGIVYLGLGILGLATIGNQDMIKLLGFLPVNGADNYLHIGLGIVIFLAGTLPRPVRVA